MAKKQPWQQLSSKQQKEAALKATKQVKEPTEKQEEKRKMIRVSEQCHAMAKAVAAVAGMAMQDYIEQVVMEDAKQRFPGVHKRLINQPWSMEKSNSHLYIVLWNSVFYTTNYKPIT